MRSLARRLSLTLLCTLALCPCAHHLRAQIPGQPCPDRSQIPVQYTWDLTRLFPDDTAWDAERRGLEGDLAGYASFEGTATDTGAGLLAALRFDERTRPRVDRVVLYAQLKSDVDVRSQEAASRRQLASSLSAKAEAARAFLPAAVARLSDGQVSRLLREEPQLAPYGHLMDSLRRRQAHTASGEE